MQKINKEFHSDLEKVSNHIDKHNKNDKAEIDKVLLKLRKSFSQLYNIAIKDEKTGLNNFKFFKSMFEIELAGAQREKETFCLAVIDIDFFKKINDTHGHDFGDTVLKKFAKLLSIGIRKCDLACRFGGEEFLILFSFTEKESAKKVLERLRKSVLKNKFLSKHKITFSAGMAEYKPQDNFKTILKRADKLLYYSKTNGRNQISI